MSELPQLYQNAFKIAWSLDNSIAEDKQLKYAENGAQAFNNWANPLMVIGIAFGAIGCIAAAYDCPIDIVIGLYALPSYTLLAASGLCFKTSLLLDKIQLDHLQKPEQTSGKGSIDL